MQKSCPLEQLNFVKRGQAGNSSPAALDGIVGRDGMRDWEGGGGWEEGEIVVED